MGAVILLVPYAASEQISASPGNIHPAKEKEHNDYTWAPKTSQMGKIKLS